MDKKIFAGLSQGLREMKAILRGEMKPARVWRTAPDGSIRQVPADQWTPPKARADACGVKAIRRKLALSQAQFSKLLGVPLATVRNWEQGRNCPDGPARALLTVAAKHPEAILDALHPKAKAS